MHLHYSMGLVVQVMFIIKYMYSALKTNLRRQFLQSNPLSGRNTFLLHNSKQGSQCRILLIPVKVMHSVPYLLNVKVIDNKPFLLCLTMLCWPNKHSLYKSLLFRYYSTHSLFTITSSLCSLTHQLWKTSTLNLLASLLEIGVHITSDGLWSTVNTLPSTIHCYMYRLHTTTPQSKFHLHRRKISHT